MNPVEKRNNEVASEILRQLGGKNRLEAMIGANSYAYSENSLSFKFCRNPGYFKGVEIILNGLDLYNIKFFCQKNAPSFEVTFEETINVYAEDLQRIFTEKTGLDIHL